VNIERNKSLKKYNTFGLDIKAKALVEVGDLEDFLQAYFLPEFENQPKLILGEGSNVLLTKNFSGLVIINKIEGKSIAKYSNDSVSIKFKSGENWHQCVLWCLEKGYYGIENLSLIPGTMGAAPMQNIGAYGVELQEVFDSLEAVNLSNGEVRVFSKDECKFGYRESIFKNTLKNQFFILSVTLKLSLKPQNNISYGDIKDTLVGMKINPSIASPKDVSNAVIKIRSSKLPNPKELGNSGSFFKNPIVPTSKFNELKSFYTDIKGFEVGDGITKIPAAWLIEKSGWKGKRVGNCGSHAKQALVLVNYGGAKGNEILELAMEIKASVEEQFGIVIEPEVNIV
jgi:UDP-N-acetylmuramate dehydrogenase